MRSERHQLWLGPDMHHTRLLVERPFRMSADTSMRLFGESLLEKPARQFSNSNSLIETIRIAALFDPGLVFVCQEILNKINSLDFCTSLLHNPLNFYFDLPLKLFTGESSVDIQKRYDYDRKPSFWEPLFIREEPEENTELSGEYEVTHA